jgi:hypothetical protein
MLVCADTGPNREHRRCLLTGTFRSNGLVPEDRIRDCGPETLRPSGDQKHLPDCNHQKRSEPPASIEARAGPGKTWRTLRAINGVISLCSRLNVRMSGKDRKFVRPYSNTWYRWGLLNWLVISAKKSPRKQCWREMITGCREASLAVIARSALRSHEIPAKFGQVSCF